VSTAHAPTADRWWRGVDAVLCAALAPGARVLDVGCGDGGLVEKLAACGLDAVGVDPGAPAHPRLVREPVERAEGLGTFDAACAVLSLHHVELESVAPAIHRLLRPGARLYVYELDWEAYDERAAAWLAERDRPGADHSVLAWRREHLGLNGVDAVRGALAAVLALERDEGRPYLARMLGRHDLEEQERSLIGAGALPALGRWLVAGAAS
jgi:SAM-dependent methyltransferase